MNASPVPVVPATADRFTASRFLSALDSTAGTFAFRTFADNRKGGGKNYTGTLAEHFDALAAANAAGDGVFVVVNEGGHKAADIARVRAVFVDLDGTPLDAVRRCDLVPHVAVESSPGRFHAYWRVDGLSLDEFASLQRAIAARFEGDKSVNDLPRVMRLPGFQHRKGEPFPVRIIHRHDGAPYSADIVRRQFGQASAAPLVAAPVAPAAPVAGAHAILPAPFAAALPAVPPLDAEAVDRALRFLPAGDAALWRRVTCALRAYGEAGRVIWDAWSRTAPAAYNEAGNRAVWAAATALDGGQRVILAEAQARGWVNALSAQNAGRPLVTFARVGTLRTVPQSWMVAGWIPSASLSAIIGASGAGKSFCALAVACSVATGSAFFDCAVEAGAVFYLAGEGLAGLKRRIDAWSLENAVDLSDAPLFLADRLPALTEPGSAAAIVAAIRSMIATSGTPRLIVVDTLHRAFGGEDENSAAAMAKFIRACDEMKGELAGATVVVIHHSGHGTNRARGSSAFYAALDAEITITKDDNGRIGFNSTKQKDAEAPIPMLLELKRIDFDNGDSSAVLTRPHESPAELAERVRESAIAEVAGARKLDGNYEYSGREAVIMIKSKCGIDVSESKVRRWRKDNES
ncbi:AAA family ATPase [Luteimonas sp. BDR2-5]|uniref:AAA family ATPase n=1 Tax=Proluteimonas luteida TaxID=2878685 RepID=UPI001E40F862|nr:AAA family ATPase [Luteimonas sp. BDR2-5]MCD9027729.1 AAA family ATPase [Luteimonas sp. BDR2-5]